MCRPIAILFLLAATCWGAEAKRLKIALVQSAVGPTVEDNCDRIVGWIPKAAATGARVVIFPEGILSSRPGGQGGDVEGALNRIREAARSANVYVVFGGWTYSQKLKKDANWMRVIGPGGAEIFRYDKLYNDHHARMPGLFHLDGVPAGAMICADRWLRAVEEIPVQQGARISIELAANYPVEWVEPYKWYWYVPRALRNNVWVIFSNTASGGALGARHGHSAIIAPDGRIVAAAPDDRETIVVADLDVGLATRAEAKARAAAPALRSFWETGLKVQAGEPVPMTKFTPMQSPETDVTIAAAQVAGDLAAMEKMIRDARAKNADLVAFPAKAAPPGALDRMRKAARASNITVVFGAGKSAFAIGPEGTVLTRREEGRDLPAMWFRVKGVPAVVTIGREGLWNEIAELAAVAGAQIHVHLDHDDGTGSERSLRRLQVGANLASFLTFSATVNVVESAIWDHLRGRDEVRAYLRNLPEPMGYLPPDLLTPKPVAGMAEVHAIWAANLVARAGRGPALLVATRRVGRTNAHHPSRTSNMNPQMAPWYSFGAQVILPKPERFCRETHLRRPSR